MNTRTVLLTAILLSLLSIAVYAQDKTQAYYAQHEREILPDAQIAFQNGNYERAILLCQWHYVIIGDNAANSLREIAEKYQSSLEDMIRVSEEGNVENALEIALALLELNPKDVAARDLILSPAVLEPEEAMETIPDSEIIEDPFNETVESIIEVQEKQEDKPEEIVDGSQIIINTPERKGRITYKTVFGIKAVASILDLKNTEQTKAYGGSIGVYNIGGGRFGGEVGGALNSSLSGIASFYEVDLAVLYRALDWLYPKIVAGYFSCNSKTVGSSKNTGICIGVGASFLIGNHFSVDLGGKYYPAIVIHSTEPVIIAGIETEFPSVSEALPGGLTPFISVGLLF